MTSSSSPSATHVRFGIARRILFSLGALVLLVGMVCTLQWVLQNLLLEEVQRLTGPLAHTLHKTAAIDRATTPMVNQVQALASAQTQANRRTREKLLRDSIRLFDDAVASLDGTSVAAEPLEKLRNTRNAVTTAAYLLSDLVQERLDLRERMNEAMQRLQSKVAQSHESGALLAELQASLYALLATKHAASFQARMPALLARLQQEAVQTAFTLDAAAIIDMRSRKYELDQTIRGALARGEREAFTLRTLTGELANSNAMAMRQAAARSLQRVNDVKKATVLAAIVMAGIVLSEAFFIHVAVTKRLSGFVEKIQNADAGASAFGGPWRLVLPETPKDELGALAQTINHYGAALQQRQHELDLAKKELEAYVAIVDQHVVSAQVDMDGRFRMVSHAFCRLFGYEKDELLGKPLARVFHSATSQHAVEDLWKTIQQAEPWSGEIVHAAKDETPHWMACQATPLTDEAGAVTGFSAISHDMTDTKRILELSVTDSLTGLRNRMYLDEMLATEFRRSRRYGTEFAVVLADVDHFKTVNDTYGHLAGDGVLLEIASLLKEHCREADIVGRWGGEEFMILCPQTSLEGTRRLAEKLRRIIAAHTFRTAGQLTMSFGIAGVEEHSSVTELLQRADSQLYQSKKQGRNIVSG